MKYSDDPRHGLNVISIVDSSSRFAKLDGVTKKRLRSGLQGDCPKRHNPNKNLVFLQLPIPSSALCSCVLQLDPHGRCIREVAWCPPPPPAVEACQSPHHKGCICSHCFSITTALKVEAQNESFRLCRPANVSAFQAFSIESLPHATGRAQTACFETGSCINDHNVRTELDRSRSSCRKTGHVSS